MSIGDLIQLRNLLRNLNARSRSGSGYTRVAVSSEVYSVIDGSNYYSFKNGTCRLKVRLEFRKVTPLVYRDTRYEIDSDVEDICDFLWRVRKLQIADEEKSSECAYPILIHVDEDSDSRTNILLFTPSGDQYVKNEAEAAERAKATLHERLNGKFVTQRAYVERLRAEQEQQSRRRESSADGGSPSSSS